MKIYLFTFIIEGSGGIFLQGGPICDNNDGIPLLQGWITNRAKLAKWDTGLGAPTSQGHKCLKLIICQLVLLT